MIENPKRSSILNPLVDFWMLGGLSILLCVIMHLVNFLKGDHHVFQIRFFQLGAVFSVLSILCNHPHFMISYRFGYGRGSKFILQNWYALILIPAALIAVYVFAFFAFDTDISDFAFLDSINRVFENLDIKFRIDQSNKLGDVILGLSIWFMYVTVGWHYCKQVFGCMMVYAFYDAYKLTPRQKSIFKWSAISVAVYQFVLVSSYMDQSMTAGSIQDGRFQGVHLPSLGLPLWLSGLSVLFLVSFFLIATGMMFYIYLKTKQKPSVHFLIPWVALYVWWVPVGNLPEFYLLMVPFFHSLQYLPFAMRVESQKIPKNKFFDLHVSIKVLILLLVGFLSFEFLPAVLDKHFQTNNNQMAWFFTTTIVLFINIHHFFIDSVVWKFKDDEIKKSLLYSK